MNLLEESNFLNLPRGKTRNINFPLGIIGFEKEKLYTFTGANKCKFNCLESESDKKIKFIIVSNEDLKCLDENMISNASKILNLSTNDFNTYLLASEMYVSSKKQVVLNLASPLFINFKKRFGVQYIFDEYINQFYYI